MYNFTPWTFHRPLIRSPFSQNHTRYNRKSIIFCAVSSFSRLSSWCFFVCLLVVRYKLPDHFHCYSSSIQNYVLTDVRLNYGNINYEFVDKISVRLSLIIVSIFQTTTHILLSFAIVNDFMAISRLFQGKMGLLFASPD